MRLWHYQLLPYLPDMQFRGQLREIVAIVRTWRATGKTNHLLINRVMDYGKYELFRYFALYLEEYNRRYGKRVKNLNNYYSEILWFAAEDVREFDDEVVYPGWHNKEYLRICMANLYEKHLGIGKNAITDAEYQVLLDGYRAITGEDYSV